MRFTMPRPGLQTSAILPCLLAALLPDTPTLARTWNIRNDGSGDAPTVQAGIDSAAVGDSVLVGPGTYIENIDFLGKDIVVKSSGGPEVTILDGSGEMESVALFVGNESRGAILEGFTITGGLGHEFVPGDRRGGGVYCAESSPTIKGNWFLNNRLTQSKGGGLYIALPAENTSAISPLIENNLFQGNHGRNGGAIAADGGHPKIRGNIFRNNDCAYDGGAIFAWMLWGSAEIEWNQFWENVAPDHGGAIYASNTHIADYVIIRWNLLIRNEAHGQGALFTGSGGAIWISEFSGVLENNTFAGNISTGESGCDGSGILFDQSPPNFSFRHNIIALGTRCGVECLNLFGPIEMMAGSNILWMNDGEDIQFGAFHCPSSWADNMIIVDPLFCNPDADNYTVPAESPALTGSAPFGVWTTPGCGPGVPVQPTTWGRLKSRYR